MLPGILWVIVFALAPLVYAVYLSFTTLNLVRAVPADLTLASYQEVVTSPVFQAAVANTLLFAVVGGLSSLLVGIIAAWVFSYDMLVIRWLRGFFSSPFALAPAAAGLMGSLFFNAQFGFLTTLGLESTLLVTPHGARLAVILVDTWRWTPLICLVMAVVLSRTRAQMPDESNILALLRHARTPLLMLSCLRLIEGLRMFDVPMTMTAGGPANATMTITQLAYRAGFLNLNLGAGAASGVALLCLTLPLLGIILVVFLRQQTASE